MIDKSTTLTSKFIFCVIYISRMKTVTRVGTMACCDPNNGNFTILNGSDIFFVLVVLGTALLA